ncbi:hypothetical protein V2W45_1473511 [Cenococcum geophilum]
MELKEINWSESSDNNRLSGRDSRHRGKGGQYYTQKCLLSLVEGGLLNKTCLNQLLKDLDTNYKLVGVYKAHGALFKVRLTLYGYTLAAKCTVINFATIYERLRPIQGNIDLNRLYFYDGIIKIVYIIFLRVLHRDAMPYNMLWNAEVKVIIIDFERAEVLKPRAKRKRVPKEGLNKQPEGRDEFMREM